MLARDRAEPSRASLGPRLDGLFDRLGVVHPDFVADRPHIHVGGGTEEDNEQEHVQPLDFHLATLLRATAGPADGPSPNAAAGPQCGWSTSCSACPFFHTPSFIW